ncbi:MAG TPA: hypothetical protein VJ963_11805 [Bacteroidales bacterium]|nr:hypothetical protein [Bacteroidales bacterium]
MKRVDYDHLTLEPMTGDISAWSNHEPIMQFRASGMESIPIPGRYSIPEEDFKKETGENVYFEDGDGYERYREEYVEWLEKKYMKSQYPNLDL